MDATLAVEPFGFFTRESLRAGWYLVWRQLVRILPVALGAGMLGGALTAFGMGVVGTLVMTLGFVAAAIWGIVLVPRLASRWAESCYGYGLSGAVGVWWGITWRVVVASLVAAVIFTPPNVVALSLSTAYQGSALGLAGHLLTAGLGLANFVVTIMATGWSMSRVAAAQLEGLPLAAAPPERVTPRPSPSLVVATATMATAPAGRAPFTGVPGGRVLAPGAARAGGKQQCPKCGLHETERGSVIGWYCTICGWRQERR
jgi:ribosomal protein L37AE/L43A